MGVAFRPSKEKATLRETNFAEVCSFLNNKTAVLEPTTPGYFAAVPLSCICPFSLPPSLKVTQNTHFAEFKNKSLSCNMMASDLSYHCSPSDLITTLSFHLTLSGTSITSHRVQQKNKDSWRLLSAIIYVCICGCTHTTPFFVTTLLSKLPCIAF